MSGSIQAFLGGGLATHARGRTLAATFNAKAQTLLPEAGAFFVLGKELQGGGENVGAWLAWATNPGRALIVVPPFEQSACDVPVGWEARRTEPLAGGETTLGGLLARERRYEIRGQLLPLERTAGQIVTGGWRKHPAAGLVIITALPVWSLTALDHRDACAAWLDDLLGQAGTASDTLAADQERVLTRDEWTVLLHLCTGPFPTTEAALEALAHSAIHTLAADAATIAMAGLAELRLTESGGLTDGGERALLEGPYAAYARALRRRP